jgi:hypothetical protein
MIYECSENHICFSKEDISICAMRGRNKRTIMTNPINIDWFYKINKMGLCINKNDLHKIIEDPNMPKQEKKQIGKIFFNL